MSRSSFGNSKDNLEGTKLVVVDSHSEVLPLWFKEHLDSKWPLIAIQIDRHHDMYHQCPALPAREGKQNFDYLAKIMPYLFEYSKKKVNEGNFACPAFHYKVVGALYHFDPRAEEINSYGRISGLRLINAPKTKEICLLLRGKRSKWIFWDGIRTKLLSESRKISPVPEKISQHQFRKDLKESHFPAAIGIDLDGLYSINDRGPVHEVLARRLKNVECLLDSISSPAFICIARSQTPRTYVPKEIVNEMQESVINLIKNIYS